MRCSDHWMSYTDIGYSQTSQDLRVPVTNLTGTEAAGRRFLPNLVGM